MREALEVGHRLEGKAAIVTGGASGIGRAIAVLFAAEGAKVAVLDINLRGAAETVECIQGQGGEAVALGCDIAQERAVQDCVEAVAADFGHLEVLVNNAAVEFAAFVTETAAEDWDRVQGVNLRGAFLCCRHAIPHMKRSGGGAIVSIASANALVGVPAHAAYSASKGGLVALTRQLAVDYGPDGIRVNCICPTTTDTPMVRATATDEDLERAAKMHPLRRIARPEDIAYAVVYLASDEAACVTGVALPVDAGWTAQ